RTLSNSRAWRRKRSSIFATRDPVLTFFSPPCRSPRLLYSCRWRRHPLVRRGSYSPNSCNGIAMCIRLSRHRDCVSLVSPVLHTGRALHGSHGRLLVRVEKVTVVRRPLQVRLWRAFTLNTPEFFFTVRVGLSPDPLFALRASSSFCTDVGL